MADSDRHSGLGALPTGIAVCGENLRSSPFCGSIGAIELDGVQIDVGRVAVHPAEFDRDCPDNRSLVLVEVTAFSCNYRDRPLLVHLGSTVPPDAFCHFGSEFAGVVLDVGPGVTTIKRGDRVIGDANYPGTVARGVPAGLATQHASQRYLVVRAEKVAPIPETMSDSVGAAFALGAQTAYSMIRRLRVAEGANILVTAGTSNTSLFVLNALRTRSVNVYAVSSSSLFDSRLQDLGVRETFVLDSYGTGFSDESSIRRIVSAIGGFGYVIDPFCNSYLSQVLPLMSIGSRYITCGVGSQPWFRPGG